MAEITIGFPIFKPYFLFNLNAHPPQFGGEGEVVCGGNCSLPHVLIERKHHSIEEYPEYVHSWQV